MNIICNLCHLSGFAQWVWRKNDHFPSEWNQTLLEKLFSPFDFFWKDVFNNNTIINDHSCHYCWLLVSLESPTDTGVLNISRRVFSHFQSFLSSILVFLHRSGRPGCLGDCALGGLQGSGLRHLCCQVRPHLKNLHLFVSLWGSIGLLFWSKM